MGSQSVAVKTHRLVVTQISLMNFSGDSCSSSLLAVKPLDESSGLDLPYQTRFDKVLRVGPAGARVVLTDLSQRKPDVLRVQMENPLEG